MMSNTQSEVAILEAKIQSLQDTGMKEINEARQYLAQAQEFIVQDGKINAVKSIGCLMLAICCLSKANGVDCHIAKEIVAVAVKDSAVVAAALGKAPQLTEQGE